MRSISNVVDATNYVLHEMGQPVHAFDLGKLRGEAVLVRRARPKEQLTTLDGATRALPDGVRVPLELTDEGRFGNGTVYLRYRAA